MMLQKIILQSKKKSSDQGFLTLEVIVATLVSFFFLMFSLQAFATAMFMKVQAQQDQRADQLIQEDIERIGGLSSALTLGLNNQLNNNLPTNCDVAAYADGYGDALWDELVDQVDTGNAALDASLLSDGTGVTLRLSRTHLNNNPSRTLKIFYQVTNSNADIDNNGDIFGDADDEVVATRYVEIIPDEALRCP